MPISGARNPFKDEFESFLQKIQIKQLQFRYHIQASSMFELPKIKKSYISNFSLIHTSSYISYKQVTIQHIKFNSQIVSKLVHSSILTCFLSKRHHKIKGNKRFMILTSKTLYFESKPHQTSCKDLH